MSALHVWWIFGGFLVDTVKNDRGTPSGYCLAWSLLRIVVFDYMYKSYKIVLGLILKRKCLLIFALFAIFKVKIEETAEKHQKPIL